jgi:hypothetical protein
VSTMSKRQFLRHPSVRYGHDKYMDSTHLLRIVQLERIDT